MSVLTDLLENYEFLPNEFKRHLLLVRELEERQKGKLYYHITQFLINLIE